MDNKDLTSNVITTRIKFADIAAMFEKICQAKTIQHKANIVKTYFESFYDFREKFKMENAAENCNTSLYPVIRLLLPKADQTSFGIHSPTMARLYIKILAIDSKSNEANILNRVTRVKGDYADVVYSVIKNRTSTSPSNITVYEVSRSLDEIADCYHNNKRANQETELARLVTDMSANEQKWIIRIILKNLHLNIRPQKILSCMHPKAVDLHSKHADLRKICELLERGDINLDEDSTIEIFSPIRPMLSGRIDRKTIDEKCSSKDFYLETKMDGERFLLHKSGEKYKYFSRRGFEYTNTFGCDILDGSLTPLLYRLLSNTIENVILDGEMMIWNKEKKYYHSKGENMDVKTLAKNHSTLRPCYVVFDVLYFNGACLVDKPLAERIRVLNTLIKEQTGVLQLCKRVKVENSNHVMECLNKAIADKEEGIVIKELDSVYKPNSRVSGWYKIKPDYIEGMVSEFDLVIIGGYYNNNKTRNYIDSFLLGVMDNSTNKSDPTFYSCANVSQGLGRDQWSKINSELKHHWNDIVYEKEGRKTVVVNPPNIILGSNSGAHVWIEPSLSIVLEVKAAELTKSSSFGTAYTLRFPRITKLRDDKSWDDCCTLEEFKQLTSTSSHPGDGPSTSNMVRKIAKRFDFNEEAPESKPKKARATRKCQKTSPKPLPIMLKDFEHGENYFKGLEFCVLSKYKRDYKLTIEHFEEKIIRHGGKIVKNPGSKTFAILAGDINIRIEHLQSLRKYNIIKLDWIERYINNESNLKCSKLDLHPTDFIATTDEYELKLNMMFDDLGDSYTKQFQNQTDLENLLTNIEVHNTLGKIHLTKQELYDIEGEILGKSQFYIFRLFTSVFYYNHENYGYDTIKLAEVVYKSRGGCIVNIANERPAYISYIVVDNDCKYFNLAELDKFLSKNCLTESRIKIISCKWIHDCEKLQKIVDCTEYLVDKFVK